MSLPPSREETIEFLVLRKFRSVLAALSPSPHQPRAAARTTTTLGRLLGQQERDQYRSELAKLSTAELQSLYDTECAALREEAQREEDARFFNLPRAAADFEHWSRAEHWSLDEAVALALGKAPEIVSWEKIKAFVAVSPFVARYARLRDLTQRAATWQKLFDPVLPAIFVKWAEDNEIDLPIELREKVEKLKGKLVDWKKAYAELKAMKDRHVSDWKGIVEQKNGLIEAQLVRINQLEAALAEMSTNPPVPDQTKPQSTIERQNMLKTIYVMANKGYGYDPAQKRSTVVSEIVNDLALAGLPLSEDTIRRYLREAFENLDEWKEV